MLCVFLIPTELFFLFPGGGCITRRVLLQVQDQDQAQALALALELARELVQVV